MKTFLREQLERFLEAVDAALAGPVDVVIIGGTAAALHYGVTRATHDIDTWTTVQADLAAAAERARAVTGLDVPILKSGVADAPYEFESRLERVLPDLRKLTVLVPERHDLVLMKLVRCYEHDLETIAEIHAHSPLSLDVLLLRFQEEMTPIGDPRERWPFMTADTCPFPEPLQWARADETAEGVHFCLTPAIAGRTVRGRHQATPVHGGNPAWACTASGLAAHARAPIRGLNPKKGVAEIAVKSALP